jgi:hypothetical protein
MQHIHNQEMVVKKHINKKRKINGENINRRRIDLFKSKDVDILISDFYLKK